MARKRREILTGVEIGSGAIKVLMGEFGDDDTLNIVGFGERPSMRVLKGDITDANQVQEQLVQALAAAEKSCGLPIGHVFLSITGSHVRSVNSIGSTIVHSADHRISDEDVVTALRNAKAYNLPPDRRVLHHMDRRYLVDGRREVVNPTGQVAGKLEADVHIIFGQHNNIETSCRMLADVLGYPAVDVAFAGVADGYAVLGPEEMERGALVLNIGAGITEYIVFHGPGAYSSGQLAVGCEHLINDLSIGLRLPLVKCRQILHDFDKLKACAEMTPDGRNRLVEVDIVGKSARHIPISSVEQIVELRLHELFEVISQELNSQRASARLTGGVHLAGGGALIPGAERLAERVFGVPVRVARPRLVNGDEKVVDSPRYLTTMGLLRWGRLSLQIAESEPRFMDQVRNDLTKLWSGIGRAFRW